MNNKFKIKKVLKNSIKNYRIFILFFSFINISWSQDYIEESDQSLLGIGVGAGVYMPTHSESKELYGSNWFNFNISPVLNSNFTQRWVVGGDLDILTRSPNKNRILAIKLGLAASKNFGSESSQCIPYLTLTGGPVYYDYAFKRFGRQISSKKVGIGVSIELGMKVQKRLIFNGKYSLYSAPDKLNLNGLSINLLYKIF